MSRADRWTIAALSAAILILAFSFAFLAPTTYQRSDIDAMSLCPVGKTTAETSFVIDATDPIVSNQLRSVMSVMRRFRDRAPVGQRLSVYLIDGNEAAGLSRPLFSKCKPKTGDGFDPLVENPRMLRRRYVDEFEKPFEALINRPEIYERTSSASPIIEALYELARQNVLATATGVKQLVVFSDLLQHSSGWDHYVPVPKTFQLYGNDVSNRLLPDFSQSEVTLYYLIRPKGQGGEYQGETHLQLWRDYFGATHNRSVSIEVLR